MNTKTTLVLALVAVGVAVYLVLVEKPWETRVAVEEPKTTAKALFDPKPEGVDRVELVRPRAETKLVFTKSGDTWTMLEPIECPATKNDVDSIVNTVSDLKYLKEYAKGDKDRPGDSVTGLDKPMAEVKLMKGEKVLAHLLVGSRLPTGNDQYVQRGGADALFECQADLRSDLRSSLVDKRPSAFRDKRVLQADLKDVIRLKVEGAKNFELVKSGENWVIESPVRSRADKTRAEQVARQFTSLSVQDWTEDEPASYKPYRLDPPRLKATMTAEIPAKAKPGDPDTKPADTQPSTETHILLVGGPADASGKNHFARLESAPWVFTVTENVVKELSADLSDLREKTLAEVNLAKVVKVETVTPGSKATLTKQKDGQWTTADGNQSDRAAVEDLIKGVRDLKATGFVESGQLIVPIDWDNPRAKVTLTQEGELNPVTVLVGPASASGKMVYVRNAAEEAVAFVNQDEVEQLLLPPASYQDRAVVSFPRERATRVEVTRPQGETVALAKTDDKWSMVSPVQADADGDAVRNLLQDLSSLRAKRVVGAGQDKAKFGLDAPQVSLAVHLQPLTAEPNTKVVGEKNADTQPAGENATKPAAESSTQPAAAATQPAGKKKPAISTQELLDYFDTLPKEKQNPLARKMLVEKLAEEKAAEAGTGTATQPAGSAASRPAVAATATKPAVAKAATRPAETQPAPPPAPTIYRLFLTQKDGKTYAWHADRQLVYELDNKVFENATAEMHDRQIAKFEVADVVEIALKSSLSDLAFRKLGEDWKYVADPILPIDRQKITEVLNDLRDIKTHRYVAYAANDLAKYGLDAQVDRAAIMLEGGKRIEILVSATGPVGDPDNSRYATLAGSSKVFLFKKEQVEKFHKQLEDFEKTSSSESGRPSPPPPPPGRRP